MGRTLSSSHRKKISEAKKGKKHSIETRKKISEALKGKPKSSGRKHSIETRKKMSDSRRGKKHSIESRKKMSDSKKGKPQSSSHRKKVSQALTGRTISVSHRKAMSQSWMNAPNRYGENHHKAILTEKDVLHIHFLYTDELKRRYRDGKKRVPNGFAQELAYHYGVRPDWISAIGHHRGWKHLDN